MIWFGKDALSIDKIKSLDEVYKFGSIQNSEIHFRWIRLGIKAKWSDIIQPAIKFVSDQGRMKFTRPVYKYFFFSWFIIFDVSIASITLFFFSFLIIKQKKQGLVCLERIETSSYWEFSKRETIYASDDGKLGWKRFGIDSCVKEERRKRKRFRKKKIIESKKFTSKDAFYLNYRRILYIYCHKKVNIK